MLYQEWKCSSLTWPAFFPEQHLSSCDAGQQAADSPEILSVLRLTAPTAVEWTPP